MNWISNETIAGLKQIGFGDWVYSADKHIDEACAEFDVTPIGLAGSGLRGVVLNVECNRSGELYILKAAPQELIETEINIIRNLGNMVPEIIALSSNKNAFIMFNHGSCLSVLGMDVTPDIVSNFCSVWNNVPSDNIVSARNLMLQWFDEVSPVESDFKEVLLDVISRSRVLLDETISGNRIVHGDLHPSNVLFDSKTSRFCAIDPLGIVGTFECEVGNAAMFKSDVLEFIDGFSSIDRRQALLWAAIRSGISASACFKRNQHDLFRSRLNQFNLLVRELDDLG